MFPVRYELNSYTNLLRNSVFKGLMPIKFNLANLVFALFVLHQLPIRSYVCHILSLLNAFISPVAVVRSYADVSIAKGRLSLAGQFCSESLSMTIRQLCNSTEAHVCTS
jgi:hypothetical protein